MGEGDFLSPVRTGILQGLLSAASDKNLKTNKIIRQTLIDTVVFIADRDFPVGKWPDLLQPILGLLDNTGSAQDESCHERLLLGLTLIHKICKRYRSAVKSDVLYTEINYVVGVVGPVLVKLYQTSLLLGPPPSPSPLLLLLSRKCAVQCNRLFLDLIWHDLPALLEDNLSVFMTAFLEHLKSPNTTTLASLDAANSNTAGVENELKEVTCKLRVSVVKIIKVFVEDRLEEDFEPYLEPFLKAIWSLMSQASSPPSTQPVNDKEAEFVAACLRLLATLAAGGRRQLFVGAEPTLLHSFVLPVLSRANLHSCFTMGEGEEDEETVEADLLGLEDRSGGHNERSAALALVRSLCQNREALDLFLGHALQHIHDKTFFLGSLQLFTAVASEAHTEARGVTRVRQGIDIEGFFQQHILPILAAPESGVKSGLDLAVAVAVRQLIVAFRHHLVTAELNSVLTVMSRDAISDGTPIAIKRTSMAALDKLLLSNTFQMDEQTRDALLNGIRVEPSKEDAIPARLLLRLVQKRTQPVPKNVFETVQRLLNHVVCKNPAAKPAFIHVTMELSGHVIMQGQTDYITGTISPLIQEALVSTPDLLPYTVQLLAAMVVKDGLGSTASPWDILVSLLSSSTPLSLVDAQPLLLACIKHSPGRLLGDSRLQAYVKGLLERIWRRPAAPSPTLDSLSWSVFEGVLYSDGKSADNTGQFTVECLRLALTRLQTSRSQSKSDGDAERTAKTMTRALLTVAVPSLGAPRTIALLEACQAQLTPNLLSAVIAPALSKYNQKQPAKRDDWREELLVMKGALDLADALLQAFPANTVQTVYAVLREASAACLSLSLTHHQSTTNPPPSTSGLFIGEEEEWQARMEATGSHRLQSVPLATFSPTLIDASASSREGMLQALKERLLTRP